MPFGPLAIFGGRHHRMHVIAVLYAGKHFCACRIGGNTKPTIPTGPFPSGLDPASYLLYTTVYRKRGSADAVPLEAARADIQARVV